MIIASSCSTCHRTCKSTGTGASVSKRNAPKLKWRSDLGELGQLYVGKSRSTRRRGNPINKEKATRPGAQTQATAGDPPKDGAEHAVPTGWHLYDGSKVEQPKWLIKGLLPESGVGIIPGQWGGYKTTTALSMGLSVMTGQPFRRPLSGQARRGCDLLRARGGRHAAVAASNPCQGSRRARTNYRLRGGTIARC